MNDIEPVEDFDRLLTEAMRAGRAPQSIPNLAKIAMARAVAIDRAKSKTSNPLVRQRQIGFLINAMAAMVLLGLMGICGSNLFLKSGNSNSTSAKMTDSFSSEMSESQNSDELVLMVSAAMIGGVLLLCMERVLSADQQTRPASQWTGLASQAYA